MDYQKESLKLHEELKGKIEVAPRIRITDKDSLSLAYTPGVAAACLEIRKDINKSFDLTRRWNTVAVVTDGSAVLGLGDIGPEAGMPVMEGKCVLFKLFADIDAFPLCIKSKDVDEIVNTITLLSGSFGGINLEDISSPRCFEIERKLKEKTDIPIFHDDQHGTAIVCLAALINALKLAGKQKENCTVIINGAGAAGVAVAKLILSFGIKNVIVCDSKGIICKGRADIIKDKVKTELAEITNCNNLLGSVADALKGADVFIGVSVAGCITKEMVSSMADSAIVFALSNPEPEIMPEDAFSAGALVVGTGRSDYPNQINNVLAFPGVFKGALKVRAKDITEEMKIAAANSIASLIDEQNLNKDYILPSPFDERVVDAVANAIEKVAAKSNQ